MLGNYQATLQFLSTTVFEFNIEKYNITIYLILKDFHRDPL